jgi:hypothetical protein
MPPRRRIPPGTNAAIAQPLLPPRPLRPVHHIVIEYHLNNPLAYNPQHSVNLTVGGTVAVRLVSFFGTPGQILAAHLDWGTNTRVHGVRNGSPSSLLALITPDISGFSTVRPGPAVFRNVPSGPTTLTLTFYDATLPVGPSAVAYPNMFRAILEVTPTDA